MLNITNYSSDGARHSKYRATPHCLVLPPGEFNSMIHLFWNFHGDNCNCFPAMLLQSYTHL